MAGQATPATTRRQPRVEASATRAATTDPNSISARDKNKRDYLKIMDFMTMFGEDSPFYIEEFPMEMLNASNEDLIDIGNQFMEMAANRRANIPITCLIQQGLQQGIGSTTH